MRLSGDVKPVFKKDSQNDKNDYSPLSISVDLEKFMYYPPLLSMIEKRRESRSSHRRSFVKKYVFRNFASLFLIKFKKIELKTLLKKMLWHRCFLRDISKTLDCFIS